MTNFEPSVVVSSDKTVLNICERPPIDEPLSSDEKLDRRQYIISELEDENPVFFGNHSFLSGMLQSFKMHKSITLSPDVIWLLIVQGFTYHVAANAEKLRSMFVSFNGKELLTVERLDLDPATATKKDWADIIDEFGKQLEKKTKDNLTEVMEPKFSTTTPCSHTCGMLSLMSAMKHYFDYKVVMGGCGYPSITIEGTVQDWQMVRQKTQALAKYQLEWWTSKLIPIIDQFIEARKGVPDYSFWLRMVRENGGLDPYDPTYIDGWLCTFFPYDKFGEQRSLERIYETRDLPSEILDTPFVLKIVFDVEKDIFIEINSQFDAGFFGMKETREGPGLYNVKPVIGWGIKVGVPPPEPPTENPLMRFLKGRR